MRFNDIGVSIMSVLRERLRTIYRAYNIPCDSGLLEELTDMSFNHKSWFEPEMQPASTNKDPLYKLT